MLCIFIPRNTWDFLKNRGMRGSYFDGSYLCSSQGPKTIMFIDVSDDLTSLKVKSLSFAISAYSKNVKLRLKKCKTRNLPVKSKIIPNASYDSYHLMV